MKRIHDSLRTVFLGKRLVFWYDPEGQWLKAFESFDDPQVRKVTVKGNELGVKVLIHRDPEPDARYLLYFPSARPKDAENWLLDLLLLGHEYKADRSSLAQQEAGLPFDFLPVVEAHVAFFDSAKRVEALKERLPADYDATLLRRTMMAVLADTDSDADSILLGFLCKTAPRLAESVLLEVDPVESILGAAKLLEPFWKEVGLAFRYVSENPSLQDFATTLFRSANPLDSGIKLDPHARVFLQRWKDSQVCQTAYRQWSLRMEKDLHVAARLESLSDAAIIRGSDTFGLFEKFMLVTLCRSFEQGIPEADMLADIQARRHSFWFGDHENGYEALAQAIALREGLASAELAVDSIDSGIARYQSSWYRIDSAYRKFCLHARRYGQVAVMERVTDWVEKTYVNNYLLPLSDRWSDQVRKLSRWEAQAIPTQTTFFSRFVQPYLDKGLKVFVIVSDALRFEAAAEFAVRVRAENRWTADLSALLAVLPSYTQLGMAALLPGRERSLQLPEGTALVDGMSATGTVARDAILKSALGGKGVAIQAEAFLEMNTKNEARALMRDHEVIYIFHNVIDKVGDAAATEAKLAEAVEAAFEELLQILRKIANANGSNMLLTADHGFLFQQSEVPGSDDLPLPKAKEWLFKNRRFALGHEVVADPSVKLFEAGAIGLAGSWTAAFPLSLGRFPLQGSGKRYVHGGVSLQEVVVPVLSINKARSDDVRRVEIEILRVPTRITTGQITLALYQENPVADKLLPRTLRVGVFAAAGKPLSDIRTIVFDSADPEPRQRERQVGLTLSREADNFNNQEVEIRLEELLPGTTQAAVYRSHRVKMQKPFGSDFDE